MRALIVLGGDAPGETLLREQAACADLTIAADRGLEAFVRCGLTPDAVLGDMDSIDVQVLARFEAQGGKAKNDPQAAETDAGHRAASAGRHG